MSEIHVEASALIPARPEEVYAILADYRNGHPNILPKGYFTGLIVEQGGYGEGTVFTVSGKMLGMSRSFYMTVTEPDPGHILAETDINAGTLTTFTVDMGESANESRVTIATRMPASSGLKGVIERLILPSAMRRVYREELQCLSDFARRRPEKKTASGARKEAMVMRVF